MNNNSPVFGSEKQRPAFVAPPNGLDKSLGGLLRTKARLEKMSFDTDSSISFHIPSPRPPPPPRYMQYEVTSETLGTAVRLNKFVRRLHDMLMCEQGRGIVEWRCGTIALHSINTTFAKEILPKYFGTRNFKTFRRQLNYYGFLHIRSYSSSGYGNTALWFNQDLANSGSDSISSVLRLKRVEPSIDSTKISAKRRDRKVEDDLCEVNTLVTGGLSDSAGHSMDMVHHAIPKSNVSCQQQSSEVCVTDGNNSQRHWNDPFVAAGLLLSLAHAAA